MSAFGHVPAAIHRRPSSSTVLVGLPLLAAVLGAILALAFGQDAGTAPRRAAAPPAVSTLAAGDLRLTLPDGWAAVRTGPEVPGFQGARTAFARSWNADVAIALLPAARPSLLPAQLDAAKSLASSRPRIARAGALRAYHYVRAPKGERVVDVVAVPTTQGVATIACSSAVPAPGECDMALGGLRLARGSFLPLDADAAFLAGLPTVAARLDAERVRLRARLEDAALAEEAARAADGLAGAYAAAGRALRPLVAQHGAAAATVRLLGALRARYRELAGALRAGDRIAFARTARAIGSDEARFAARLQTWQRVLAPLAAR
jgi:hypothetical protein